MVAVPIRSSGSTVMTAISVPSDDHRPHSRPGNGTLASPFDPSTNIPVNVWVDSMKRGEQQPAEWRWFEGNRGRRRGRLWADAERGRTAAGALTISGASEGRDRTRASPERNDQSDRDGERPRATRSESHVDLRAAIGRWTTSRPVLRVGRSALAEPFAQVAVDPRDPVDARDASIGRTRSIERQHDRRRPIGRIDSCDPAVGRLGRGLDFRQDPATIARPSVVRRAGEQVTAIGSVVVHHEEAELAIPECDIGHLPVVGRQRGRIRLLGPIGQAFQGAAGRIRR